MEALLIVFLQMAFACAAPLFAVMAAALSVIVEFMAALLGAALSTIGSTRRKREPSAAPAKPRPPLIPKKVVHWTAGICATLGVLGVAASFAFFQPIMRYAIDAASKRAGMEVSYASAEGTLLTGQVTLRDVTLRRDSAAGLAVDLKLDEASVDVGILSLLSDEIEINQARLVGLTGQITPPEKNQDKPDRPTSRRSFRANLLMAGDITLDIKPRDAAAYALEIPQATVAPFHSRSALFALLFRSNMEARIAGQTLKVETSELTEFGRSTSWRFQDVEAERMKEIIPRAPLTWLNGGTINVSVTDEWSLSDNFIDMDWWVTMQDVAVRAPKDAGAGEKILANGLRALAATKGGDADLRYRLQLDEGQVKTLRSGDMDRFWDVVLAGFLERPEPADTEREEVTTDESLRDTLGRIGNTLLNRDGDEENQDEVGSSGD